jgi:anaerobic C4-dicarboxylate transporter
MNWIDKVCIVIMIFGLAWLLAELLSMASDSIDELIGEDKDDDDWPMGGKLC